MKKRTDCCSFCRKSYRDVGPLVEGPGDVYICGECVKLCQTIIEQEKRRRGSSIAGDPPQTAAAVRAGLDQLIRGQEAAKDALASAVQRRSERSGQDGQVIILLTGPSRSSKVFLARALAHVLGVPFAEGGPAALVQRKCGSLDAVPLLSALLHASDYDVEAAQNGVIYVDGLDQPEVQQGLLRLWGGEAGMALGGLSFEVGGIFFVCGGVFVGLEQAVIGRVPLWQGQRATDTLSAIGILPELADRLHAIASVPPLDEEAVARIYTWVDFNRSKAGPSWPSDATDTSE